MCTYVHTYMPVHVLYVHHKYMYTILDNKRCELLVWSHKTKACITCISHTEPVPNTVHKYIQHIRMYVRTYVCTSMHSYVSVLQDTRW